MHSLQHCSTTTARGRKRGEGRSDFFRRSRGNSTRIICGSAAPTAASPRTKSSAYCPANCSSTATSRTSLSHGPELPVRVIQYAVEVLHGRSRNRLRGHYAGAAASPSALDDNRARPDRQLVAAHPRRARPARRRGWPALLDKEKRCNRLCELNVIEQSSQCVPYQHRPESVEVSAIAFTFTAGYTAYTTDG